jgi:hypothetical protein
VGFGASVGGDVAEDFPVAVDELRAAGDEGATDHWLVCVNGGECVQTVGRNSQESTDIVRFGRVCFIDN